LNLPYRYEKRDRTAGIAFGTGAVICPLAEKDIHLWVADEINI
jgi:hypothetical protein